MEVTGHQLRRVLKRWERRRGLLQSQWQQSQYAFGDEDKPSPEEVLSDLAECEARIAQLQAAQTQYNLTVEVTVRFAAGEGRMSLLEAIKRVGGVSRLEALVKQAAQTEGNTGYYFAQQAMTRSADEERAVRQLDTARAGALLDHYGDMAEALREAIAVGNETAVDLPGLGPELFA